MTDRRTVLFLMAAGWLPAKGPLFFTAEEHGLLDRLCETIIPGSRAARVADYIDLVIANSAAEVQRHWRTGLESLAGVRAFEKAAQAESPFFVELKRATVHGYYTSEAGLRQELGYRGPEALSAFPGCEG